MEGYLNAFPRNYHKTDVFYFPTFQWRGRIIRAPRGIQDRIIAGHSDYPLTSEIAYRYPARVWWAVNSHSGMIRGLPLGITPSNTQDSPMNAVYGDIDVMRRAIEVPKTTKNRVYMNFKCETHPSRNTVFGIFKDKPWVTVGTHESTLEGRYTYLKEMRCHDFVVCPRGNGVDTHRLWEALYMESIPIVETHIVHRGWQDLPIAWVTNWEEVTEEWLDTQLIRIKTGVWAYEKLKLSYWIDRINAS